MNNLYKVGNYISRELEVRGIYLFDLEEKYGLSVGALLYEIPRGIYSAETKAALCCELGFSCWELVLEAADAEEVEHV